MRVPGFVGSSDRAQSSVANSERTMNWHVELLPRGSKNQAALFPTPGQSVLMTLTDIGARALFTMNDRTLGVYGAGLYGLDVQTLTKTRYGTIAADANPAQIVMNGSVGNQALVASGTNGYSVDLTTNAITTVLTGDCVQVGFLNGSGIAFNPVTSRFRISDLNDFGTWDPTQFATRNDAPDDLKGIIVNAPDLWLIGGQSGCVWFYSGAFPFPLEPRAGANFKYGTPSGFSLASAGDSVLWLSQNAEGAGIVVQARGYSPQPVSTPSVENRIAQYQRDFTINDAEAWCYQQAGHTFYILRFPTANATEVYDLTTGLWHERGTYISSRNAYDVWHPRVHTHAHGKHYVGDAQTGNLYTLDVTIGTEGDGSAIRRERVTPSLFAENRQVLVRVLEVFVEMGLGTSTGQGVDPMIMVETSDDGGKTYGRQRQGSVGKIGQYQKRLRFTRMGLPRDRVHRVTATDPIPWRVIDAFINNESGAGA